jgi:hypothetical protein
MKLKLGKHGDTVKVVLISAFSTVVGLIIYHHVRHHLGPLGRGFAGGELRQCVEGCLYQGLPGGGGEHHMMRMPHPGGHHHMAGEVPPSLEGMIPPPPPPGGRSIPPQGAPPMGPPMSPSMMPGGGPPPAYSPTMSSPAEQAMYANIAGAYYVNEDEMIEGEDML